MTERRCSRILNLAGPTPEANKNDNGRKKWEWMLIDSAIIGGIAAFAAIGSAGPCWETVWVAFKAFGLAFFMQLATERGLKRPQPESS